MIVGFLDDFIKVHYRKNQGLKAYQKIIFQVSVAVIVGVYCYNSQIDRFYIPFVNAQINMGIFTIPVVTLILLAITNSVNLTDGLDGLAGQVSFVYLFFLSALILLQYENLKVLYLGAEEYQNLLLLSSCLMGGILGFLLFNMNKAKVFMGDTGSLALGGFLGAISIFTSNGLFIPLLGIMFVLSSISVIVQVAYFKKTKKRVFLMAPLHHHFQLKGYTETQIGFVYSLVTAVCGLIAILSYL
jgi:phospho-N-acetylmuramoyl-pentapeptide-transferase